MNFTEYLNAPGLSASSMNDLEISPLRYWHRHVNPDRQTEDDKDCFALGSALHCAVLEPKEFSNRYFCELDRADFPGCLVTVTDIKGWLKDKGVAFKSTALKPELAAVVLAHDPNAFIWDRIQSDHGQANAGKAMLSVSEFHQVENMAHVLKNEPELAKILEKGCAEVSLFAEHPKHKISTKARIDWRNDEWIVDLKTFSSKGKPINKAIRDAIYYEKYYRQACHYVTTERAVRSAAIGKEVKPLRYLMAFIETEEPHDIRLVELSAKTEDGAANLYWNRGKIEIDALAWSYKFYSDKFGTNPWISNQDIELLTDEDLKQLAWD